MKTIACISLLALLVGGLEASTPPKCYDTMTCGSKLKLNVNPKFKIFIIFNELNYTKNLLYRSEVRRAFLCFTVGSFSQGAGRGI